MFTVVQDPIHHLTICYTLYFYNRTPVYVLAQWNRQVYVCIKVSSQKNERSNTERINYYCCVGNERSPVKYGKILYASRIGLQHLYLSTIAAYYTCFRTLYRYAPLDLKYKQLKNANVFYLKIFSWYNIALVFIKKKMLIHNFIQLNIQ